MTGGIFMLRISIAVALALGTALAAAQTPQPDVMVFKPGMRMSHGCPPPPVPAGRGGTFNISLNAPAEVVEGAPYSGVGITEVVQVLADGNRIVNKNTMRYYRDSEGRTRTEYELAAVGPFALEQARSVITINDPVTGKHFVLHESQKRADVFPGAMAVDPTEVRGAVHAGEGRKMVVRHRAAGAGAPPADVVFFAGPATGAVRLPHGAGCGPEARKLPNSNPLGERVIEGIKTVGSALTFQIPAGEVGNEQPITVRSEQWFSPELRVVVASTHRDPLAGDTTYRLEQISRAEPDPSLFTVPEEYAKHELPAMGTRVVVGTGEGGGIVPLGETTQAPQAVRFGVPVQDAPSGGGARVTFVRPGSVAERAGVREGDAITRLGAKQVRSGVDVVTAMEAIQAGSRAPVAIVRDGKASTLEARF
jgi:hypothetical protein